MNVYKKFLIIDVNKCIDCDNCIQACERRHGVTRFNRYGFEIGTIRIPTSCKNCEDPECIKSCKIEGMTKTNHRFTQPKEICIGCGVCAKNCPFNAISMVSREGYSLQIHYEKVEDKNEHEKLLQKAQKRKKEIWKCDGCADYKNRGCVYNCPTGALQEVVLADFIKTIPLEWAEELVRYLSPAFLSAEEKELLQTNQAKLVFDEMRNIKIEKVEAKESVAV